MKSKVEKRIAKNMPKGAKLIRHSPHSDLTGFDQPDSYSTRVVYEYEGKIRYFTLKNTGKSRRKFK